MVFEKSYFWDTRYYWLGLLILGLKVPLLKCFIGVNWDTAFLFSFMNWIVWEMNIQVTMNTKTDHANSVIVALICFFMSLCLSFSQFSKNFVNCVDFVFISCHLLFSLFLGVFCSRLVSSLSISFKFVSNKNLTFTNTVTSILKWNTFFLMLCMY
jgi:hypothetical protein